MIVLVGGEGLARLFMKDAEVAIIENIKTYLIFNTASYSLLALVNIVRFLIQGMGFPTFAILAGVLEMIARTIAGIVLVPVLGFVGVCMGNPAAWILADAFLIPAYFIVKKRLYKRMDSAN